MASKKFTINTLMKSIPEISSAEVKLEGDCFKDVTLEVRHTLSIEDAVRFVKDISATCIDDEHAEFMPELFDFAVRLYVVMYYANVDISKDVKKAYRILYDTTLFEQVYAHINQAQSTLLIHSAEERIGHWKNLLSSTAAGKMSEIIRKIEDVVSSGGELMGALDGEDFKAAIERLTNIGILDTDESSLLAGNDSSMTESISPKDIAKAAELLGDVVNIKRSDS